MTPPSKQSIQPYLDKARRHKPKIITGAVIALLLLIIAFETAIIVVQKQANQRIEAQSQKALGRFMKQGQPSTSGGGTNILFKNIRFCWSQQICINTNHLSATAVATDHSGEVNFDNLNDFIVNVHNASVLISPQTLQGMFNESVFNFPGSNLRDLTVGIEKAGDLNHVKLTGSLKYFIWIPFEMDTNLGVDRKSNTLTIAVNTLHVFGIIPATWLIELKPFNLQKLLTLPPNKYLSVHQNIMLVKPFGLFPPPRISGQMSKITVMPKLIQLDFSGSEPGSSNIPKPQAGNYIYLNGGTTQFGKLKMVETQIQVIDKHPSDLFQFSLLSYLSALPDSQVELLKNGGVTVAMPDLKNIASTPITPKSPENRKALEQAQQREHKNPEDFFQKVKRKFHEWFGI